MANHSQQSPSTVYGHGSPSHKLKLIATFIMSAYATTWFAIKVYSCCKNGAKHIFQLINSSRYLSSDLKEIFNLVIQRNSFFTQTENILISMITDDREHVRELGLRMVYKHVILLKDLQQSRLPTLNLASANYTEILGLFLTKFYRTTSPTPRKAIFPKKNIDEIHQTQQKTCH